MMAPNASATIDAIRRRVFIASSSMFGMAQRGQAKLHKKTILFSLYCLNLFLHYVRMYTRIYKQIGSMYTYSTCRFQVYCQCGGFHLAFFRLLSGRHVWRSFNITLMYCVQRKSYSRRHQTLLSARATILYNSGISLHGLFI